MVYSCHLTWVKPGKAFIPVLIITRLPFQQQEILLPVILVKYSGYLFPVMYCMLWRLMPDVENNEQKTLNKNISQVIAATVGACLPTGKFFTNC
jgi:hypothetical protein